MKKQWKWAIGLVLFCLLAPIVWTVISLGVRFHAIDEGVVVASGFLNALRNHDYAAAHALMAPSEQTAISVTALQRAQEQIEKKHGLWLSPAMKLEHHPNEALDHITYFYEVGARDEAECRLWSGSSALTTAGGFWNISMTIARREGRGHDERGRKRPRWGAQTLRSRLRGTGK